MRKPTAVQQAAQRMFRELRFILAELHRLPTVVSWQRSQLERKDNMKPKNSLAAGIQRFAEKKHATGQPRRRKLDNPRRLRPRRKP